MDRLRLLSLLCLFVASAASLKCNNGERLLVRNSGCRFYLECTDGMLVVNECKAGELFDSVLSKCMDGTKTTCEEINYECAKDEVAPHPFSKHLYFECEKGRMSVRFCSAGSFFNPTTKTCQSTIMHGIKSKGHGSSANRAKRDLKESCEEGSKHRDGKSCRDYVVCINGVEVKKSCPDCMNYDEVTQRCRFSVLLPCGPDSVMPTPTPEPTVAPTQPSTVPPTEQPTEAPTEEPTEAPTEEPTEAPTEPTVPTTDEPIVTTGAPTEPTDYPSESSTASPTELPTEAPTEPTVETTDAPFVTTSAPTGPTDEPTKPPTSQPTEVTSNDITDPLTTTEPPSTYTSSSAPPTPPTTTACVEGEKIPVKDPNCKAYKECVKGQLTDKVCSWGFQFDIDKKDCISSFWHKVHCDK